MPNIEIRENTLTPELFCELFSSVGWGAPGVEQAAVGLKATVRTFTAYENDRPVGMARLLGDNAMTFYLKDFVVVPDCQGKGVGRLLMESVEAYIRSSLPAGWAVSLELISSKGREGFYEKFGFEQRPCDWDGAGMFKMICP